MTKVYHLLVFVLSFLAVGCFEDKGNYNYTELSEVTAKKFPESCHAIFMNMLHIDPEVSSSNPDDRFSYLWTLNPKPDDLSSVLVDVDTIGTGSVLDYLVKVRRGSYELGLWVTNESNGNATFYKSDLTVSSEFSTGFYVLKEMDGATELDLHLPDGKVVRNVIETVSGKKWNDRPIGLGIIPLASYVDKTMGDYAWTPMISVCTENDVKVFNVEDMSVIMDHSAMFYTDVPKEKPYYMWHNVFGVAYMSDLGLYFSKQLPPSYPTSGQYGFPQRFGEYKPNKQGVFDGWGFFFFDELNKRFLCMDYNGEILNFDEEGEFPNDIPHKLLYFGRHQVDEYSGTGYAIFEDGAESSKRYLYTLNLSVMTSANPILSVLTIPAESGLISADLYAVNERTANVMHFVKDKQLYMYDLVRNEEFFFQPEGLDRSEEIVYISNRYYYAENESEKFDYLAIGTQKGNEYKLYLYNTLGGYTDGAPQRVLKGEGQIVKLHYIAQSMNENSYAQVPGSF